MRLLGVAMVRNEADVVEAFVRHNLTVLDGLAVIDHGSADGTAQILARLRDEGLALQVTQDATPAFRQSARITPLTRQSLSRDAADFVFALDADEFLKVESRAKLEQALADVPAGTHALMHWLTYVPDALDGDPGAFGAGHLWWRLAVERHALHKVIVGRSFLERPDDIVANGNHFVQKQGAESARTYARLRRDVVALAHCPVRSRSQFEGKIIVNHLAQLAALAEDQQVARHWRELYEELRGGATLNEERLREIACNYGLPPKMWQPVSAIELVEDPVPLVFEQRYRVDAVPGALQLLLRFTEALVAAERERALREARATRYYSI